MDNTYGILGTSFYMFKRPTTFRSHLDHSVKNVEFVFDHSWTVSVQHSKQVCLCARHTGQQ